MQVEMHSYLHVPKYAGIQAGMHGDPHANATSIHASSTCKCACASACKLGLEMGLVSDGGGHFGNPLGICFGVLFFFAHPSRAAEGTVRGEWRSMSHGACCDAAWDDC